MSQARKNREISALQRKIDEVPSRAELSQYQRRFVELYNQSTYQHTLPTYTLQRTPDFTIPLTEVERRANIIYNFSFS